MADPALPPSPTTNVPIYPDRNSIAPGGETQYVIDTGVADNNLPLWNTSLINLDANVSTNADVAYNNALESAASAVAAQTAQGLSESARDASIDYANGTGAGNGSSEQWATLTGAEVVTGQYSSEEHAIGTTVPTGSSKSWASTAEDVLVDGINYSSLHWAAKAKSAVATLPAGTINDGLVALDKAWSSQKITDELAASGTKGTLTQSFIANQQSTINLTSSSIDAVVVTATKEIPQTGISSDHWDVAVDGSNFDVEDTAYATTLTPSAVSGNVTLTLGTGSFTVSDVGKTITGNGGSAVLADASGAATTVTDFTDTNPIASGEWTMESAVFGVNGVEISNLSNGYDLGSSSYSGNSYTSGVPAVASHILFFNNGSDALISGNSLVTHHQLSTPYDISTMSPSGQTLSTSGVMSTIDSIRLKPDGTELFMVSSNDKSILKYDLSIPFDVSTGSYNSNFYDLTGSTPRGFFLSPSGDFVVTVDVSASKLFRYNMSTNYDLTTIVYSGTQAVVSEASPIKGLGISSDGATLTLNSAAAVFRYTLSTPFDISTISYDTDSYSFTAETTNGATASVKDGGDRLFVVDDTANTVYQYSSGAYTSVVNSNIPVITNNSGQIDSTYWIDINSKSANETLNGQPVNYAFSQDDRRSFYVLKQTDGQRTIARYNLGTWEYNSNAAYLSETWAASSVNSMFGALSEAMVGPQNQMDSTKLSLVGDADFPALTNTIDLAIILFTNNSSQIPSSSGVTINYDANVLNEGAVNGADYTFDQPDSNTVRIKSLKKQNLKVRVL